jgi:hypothetical protein
MARATSGIDPLMPCRGADGWAALRQTMIFDYENITTFCMKHNRLWVAHGYCTAAQARFLRARLFGVTCGGRVGNWFGPDEWRAYAPSCRARWNDQRPFRDVCRDRGHDGPAEPS